MVAIAILLPLAFVALRAALPAIGPRTPPPPTDDRPTDAPPPGAPGSGGPAGTATCAPCHAAEHAAWSGSTHAAAERELGAGDPRSLTALGPDGAERDWPLARAIGVDPLIQYLVEIPGTGRFQVTQAARRTADGAWFDVFGDDRRPGEWGHWTGAGMTWNARCAECHTTGFRKNLVQQGTYRSTWSELGVGCGACHGVPDGHAGRGDGVVTAGLDGCAVCHARRAALTEDWRPGEALLDHYAPALVDLSDTFRPDGGVRDEDFEYTAFLGAKMHAAGVTCTSCHDPHTGRTRLPGDALCLSCHAALPSFRPDHPHHGPDQAACTSCHMPVTTYMQADARHDHVFSVPDPALTRDEGVPNACAACHAAGGAAAPRADLVAAAARWWGRRDPQPRSLALARARREDPRAIPELLHQLSGAAPAWRAAAAVHLGPFLDRDEVREALVGALGDADPLVRYAAADTVAAVAPHPAVEPALRPLLKDGTRAVRVAAARALRGRLGPGSPDAKDYVAYLGLHLDDPSALAERGTWALERGEAGSARMDLESARGLDPASVPVLDALALLAARSGRPADALKLLREATALAPADEELRFRLALAQAETGDEDGAAATLAAVVAAAPTHVRAWYDLGLLQARAGGTAGVEALRRAVELAPEDPEIRWALATVLAKTDRAAAQAEARRVLERDPGHAAARAFLASGG